MKRNTRLFLGITVALAVTSLIFTRPKAVINPPGELREETVPIARSLYRGIVKQYVFLPWYMSDY